MDAKKDDDKCCQEKKANASRQSEQKSCSEENAMKHNANASSVTEVKESAENANKKKQGGKVAEKPADYVVESEDQEENKVPDAGLDKFGSAGT